MIMLLMPAQAQRLTTESVLVSDPLFYADHGMSVRHYTAALLLLLTHMKCSGYFRHECMAWAIHALLGHVLSLVI